MPAYTLIQVTSYFSKHKHLQTFRESRERPSTQNSFRYLSPYWQHIVVDCLQSIFDITTTRHTIEPHAVLRLFSSVSLIFFAGSDYYELLKLQQCGHRLLCRWVTLNAGLAFPKGSPSRLDGVIVQKHCPRAGISDVNFHWTFQTLYDVTRPEHFPLWPIKP